MTLTERARRHNPAAFDAELKAVAMIRRQHGDHNTAMQIEQSIICRGASEWTENVARRFVHVLS